MTELIMACRSDQTLFGKNTLFHYRKNKIKNIPYKTPAFEASYQGNIKEGSKMLII